MAKTSKTILFAIAILFSYMANTFGAVYSGKCGISATFYFNSTRGLLEIEGTGKMYDYYYDYSPWAEYASSVKEVSIAQGITSIGDRAFSGCSITSVTIPSNVTSIGRYAFNCASLRKVIFNAENCTSCGSDFSSAFSTGIKEVVIGEKVRTIPYCAFYGCSGLTSVTIPNSVTSIGGHAFSGCSGLTSVTIPNSVTSIGSYAFDDCSKVIFNAENCTSCGSEYDPAFSTGIKEIVIGEKVKNIPAYTFKGCSKLTSVTIGNSVTSIGSKAFYGCSGLTSVTIPNSVTSIGYSAFCGCSGLTSVTIPNSVTSIGSQAFYGCSGLTSMTISNSVTIPNSVTSIGEHAFSGCTGLTSVTISNSVTSIGYSAFYECSNLKKAEFASIESLCKISFDRYSNPLYEAKHLYINGKEVTNLVIPNSVTSIGSYTFENCMGLTSVTIPSSVTSIGSYAFNGCSGLSSVTIPNSVTSIGSSAFCKCTSITNVKIGNGVEIIPFSCFSGCSSLKTISIGSSVRGIGGSAFSGAERVTEIYALPTIPPTCYSEVFHSYVYKAATLYVPKGNNAESRYKADNVWKDFFSIVGKDMSEIDKPVLQNYKITTSSTGYATFYSSASAYKLPVELSAQVVSLVRNNKLVCNTIADGFKGGVIPKGTAVLLANRYKGSATFTLTPVESSATYTGTNYLHGSDVATTTSASGNNYYYKLTNGTSGNFGWYWGAYEGGAFSIDANKAWLALPKSSVTRGWFNMEDDVTEVDVVKANEENKDSALYYDLQGRRMVSPKNAGLYIKNGKKVIIKK